MPSASHAADPTTPSSVEPALDALITAGKLYLGRAPSLIALVLGLQAIKALVLLGLVDAFGEEVGGTVAWVTSSILLAVIDAVSVRLAIDVHHGDPPATPLELLRRTAPILPVALALGAISTLAMTRYVLPLSLGLNPQWLLVPAAALYVGLLDSTSRLGKGAGADDALAVAQRRTSAFLVPVLLLFGLQLFSLELIPALADSAVGRKAPLWQWIPTEALISTFVTPIVAMAVATLYLRAGDRELGDETPRTAPVGPLPWPPAHPKSS